MKMVCPWRPLNSDVLFRWSGERLSLLTLSACFSGTSKGYGLVKYASKACSIQARHVLEGCHLTSCVRANTLYFSRQNTAVWFLIIRLRVRAQIRSIFLVKTKQCHFSWFDFRCARKETLFFSSKHSSFDLSWFDFRRARKYMRSIFLVKTQQFDFSLFFILISACFSGTSKGYGLVKYASKASSIQARHVLEGYQVRDGHTLDCDWLQHNRPIDTVTSLHSKCLYVDQLPADYRDMAQFRRLFSKVVNPPYCQVSFLRILLSGVMNLDILYPIICSVLWPKRRYSAKAYILRLRKCQILWGEHYSVLGNIHKWCLV